MCREQSADSVRRHDDQWVQLIVDPLPTAAFDIYGNIVCATQPTRFTNQSLCNYPLTYSWDFGDGSNSTEADPVHTYATTGFYTPNLIVTTPYGCSDTVYGSSVQAYDIPYAAMYATPTDTSIFNPHVTVYDQSIGGTIECAINWGDGAITTCDTPEHDYRAPGEYTITLSVLNEYGCFDTATVIIRIRPEYRSFIPNAFSPNGDGVNDIFLAGLIGVNEYSFYVYDRWGKLLFETHNPDEGWDGRYSGDLCHQGLYVYSIEYSDEVSLFYHHLTGTIMLIR